MEPLPTADLGTLDTTLESVAATGARNVWAVGYVFPPNEVLVMHDDGSGLRRVTTPSLPAGTPMATDVATTGAADAWITGAIYLTASNSTQPFVMHWDGTALRNVAFPSVPFSVDTNRGPRVAELSPDNVWVTADSGGGDNLIAHWNGATWTLLPHPDSFYVEDIAAAAPDDVYTIGSKVLHWDGKSWSTLVQPVVPFASHVSVLGSSDVWLAAADGMGGEWLEHWDGTGWSRVDQPARGLIAMDVSPDHVLWALIQPIVGPVRLERWAGSSWVGGSASDGLTDVAALGAQDVRISGRTNSLPYVARLCALRLSGGDVLPGGGLRVDVPGSVTFIGAGPHQTGTSRAADSLGLFDTGALAPGAMTSFTYPSAGTFYVRDTTTGAKAPVAVALRVTEPGPYVDVFYASEPLPPGLTVQLQLRDPGSTTFRNLRVNPASTYKQVGPAQFGTGTFAVRARLRVSASAEKSGWSPVATFTLR